MAHRFCMDCGQPAPRGHRRLGKAPKGQRKKRSRRMKRKRCYLDSRERWVVDSRSSDSAEAPEREPEFGIVNRVGSKISIGTGARSSGINGRTVEVEPSARHSGPTSTNPLNTQEELRAQRDLD